MKMNGVHKSNNYTPKGLFFELVSLGGKKVEKTFDSSECVVLDKNTETSTSILSDLPPSDKATLFL